jgi:hypothetical protein
MRKSEQKRHLEYTFRNLLRVAKEVNVPHAWAFLHIWCRAKEGGRHKALGHRGDNDWCFKQIPESKRIYDPALSIDGTFPTRQDRPAYPEMYPSVDEVTTEGTVQSP